MKTEYAGGKHTERNMQTGRQKISVVCLGEKEMSERKKENDQK